MQKKFGVGRASLGSLSESVSIFDPERLKQIAATLATEVPSAEPSRFDVIGKQYWWQFDYVDEGFTTASELHIPVDTEVFINLDGTLDEEELEEERDSRNS